MKVLLATIGILPGLDAEDSLGLGYLSAHLRNYTEISNKGFITLETLDTLLQVESPDLLFLGSFTGVDSTTLYGIDIAFKHKVPVVLGGPGFSLPVENPAMYHPGVSRIIFGEADAVDPALLLGITTSAAPGVWHKKASLPKRPAVLADPDSVPYPERISLQSGKEVAVRIATSRGCPFHCTYCPLPLAARLTGVGWRPRRIEAISAELDNLVRLGVRHVSLTDDSATPIRNGHHRMDSLVNVFRTAGVSFSAMVSPPALLEATARQIESWRIGGLQRVFLLLNNLSGLRGEQLRPEANSVIIRLLDSGIDVEPGWITIDPFMTASQFLDRLNRLTGFSPKNINAYVRPLSILPGTIEEQRYNKSNASIPAGPRAQKAGVSFKFVYKKTAAIVDEFLEFLENLSPIKDNSIIAYEVKHWVNLSKVKF